MFDPITIASVVVLLGLLILVHELGHFVVAKSFGVRVDVFSIGFGPRLWGWRRGPTDYRLSAFPLGGYVKMAGDNPMEERAGEPDEFLSKTRWQRAIIALAGPTMNIVLAVVLLAGIFFFVGIPYPAYLNLPVEVVAFPKDAPGAAAGLRAGDRVVEINGVKVTNWEQALTQLAQVASGSEEVRLTADRGGEMLPVTVSVQGRADSSAVLGYPLMPAVVDQVGTGRPAEKAGLKPEDEILALNGKPIRTWPQFTEGVRGSNGQTLHVLIRRGAQQMQLTVNPVLTQNERGETVWQIGMINRIELAYRSVGPLDALTEAGAASWAFSRQILGVVGKLVQGKVSIKQLGGPVEIARQSGQAAKRGLQEFIGLMVLISLNLAILNLLPIPILDGGHILMLSIEGVMRRDLSLAVKERFVTVGMVFLLVIFAIVMYNDVFKSFR